MSEPTKRRKMSPVYLFDDEMGAAVRYQAVLGLLGEKEAADVGRAVGRAMKASLEVALSKLQPELKVLLERQWADKAKDGGA